MLIRHDRHLLVQLTVRSGPLSDHHSPSRSTQRIGKPGKVISVRHHFTLSGHRRIHVISIQGVLPRIKRQKLLRRAHIIALTRSTPTDVRQLHSRLSRLKLVHIIHGCRQLLLDTD